jgi:glutathione transport system permease protein
MQLELLQREDTSRAFADFIGRFSKQKSAVAAALALVILIFIAIFCYQIVPYGFNDYDYDRRLRFPDGEHIFGTDEFGRDLFSRVLCGTQISMSVGFISISLAALLGCPLGLIAGFYGGVPDAVIMRIGDVLNAFPGLILAIAIVAVLGQGLVNVALAIIIFTIPVFAMLTRGQTLVLKETVYVRAAKSMGASDARVLFRHILPGTLPSAIVQFSISIGNSIMTTASLSFLGLGAQAPTPEWGLLLSTARVYVYTNWYYAFFPGMAIFVCVLCFNLVGDGLRTALDPKLNDRL